LEIALEKPLDEDTKDVLRKSHSASQSLVYVIDDLLNLTNAQETNFDMLEAAFDITAGMAEIFEPLRAYAERKGLAFSNTIDSHQVPEFVRGDLQRFQQILTQVVSNAIRHTSEGSVTVVSRVVSTRDSYCLLETQIRDTGEGLSENELDDIFQDLEQVSADDPNEDAPLSPTTLGPAVISQEFSTLQRLPSRARVGIGLALAARFVLLRDGQLRMKSTKDEGTVVTISLPWMICTEMPSSPLLIPQGEANSDHSQQLHSLRSPAQHPAEGYKSVVGSVVQPIAKTDSLNLTAPLYSKPPAASLDLASVPMVVAIADDNAINLQVLKRRLEILGHKVLVSRNGQECFEVFEEKGNEIQFILMDLDVSSLIIPNSRRCIC
jgi:CheY-like chemotaxis protein